MAHSARLARAVRFRRRVAMVGGSRTVHLARVRMNVLGELPRSPASHFRLHAYAAVLLLRARLPPPDGENGLGFLDGYYEELTQAGFAASMPGEEDHWWELVHAW